MRVTGARGPLAAGLRASAEAEPELADMYSCMALETEELKKEDKRGTEEAGGRTVHSD